MKSHPKDESPRDLLVTRPDKPLREVLNPQRPFCCPVDPKPTPQGASPEAIAKAIDYTA